MATLTPEQKQANLKAFNTIQTPAQNLTVNQADVRPTGTAFNPMQDLQRSSLQTTGKPIDIPKSFDAGTLGSSPKPVVPEAPAPQGNNPDATVGTATDYVTRFNKAQEQAAAAVPNTATLENTNLYNRLKDLYTQSTSKGTDLLAQQEKANVGGITKQIEEQNLLVQQKANQYQKNIQMLSGQGRGITTGIISGQTDRERRLAAADIGAETAILQAMQGNLTLAKQTAQDAIDLKYKPIEDEIAQKLKLLELNAPQMTAEEKKRADITAGILQEQQQQIADKKAVEANISNVLAEAAKNGATQDVLQKIKTSTNLNDAILSAGSFIAPKEEQKPQQIGTDSSGNPIYGVWDKNTQTFKTVNAQPAPQVVTGQQVGTILGLPTYDTRSTNPGMNRSDRNNNPGNIKASSTTINYPGVIGIESSPAADGGNFLIFADAASGINAISQLLISGKSYKGVTAEQAIKKYNGGGSYGAADVGLDPNTDFQSQIQDPTKRQEVAAAIAKKEGFTGKNTPTPQVSTTAQDWASQINAGKATIANVPEKDRSSVISELAKTPSPTDTKQEAAARAKIALIDEIKKSPGLSGAVGGSWLTRFRPIASLTGSTANFIASVQQLTNQETLDSLLTLKKAGGTLGALNESEGKMLRDAATKINGWALSKDGKVYAYAVDEKHFKEELDRIKSLAEKAVLGYSAPEVQTMDDGKRFVQNSDGSYTEI